MFGFNISDIVLTALAILLAGGACASAACIWKKKFEESVDRRCKTIGALTVPFLLLCITTVAGALLPLRIPMWRWLQYVIAVFTAIVVSFVGRGLIGQWAEAEKCLSCDRYTTFRTEHEVDAGVETDIGGEQVAIEHRIVTVRRCSRCGVRQNQK